MTATRMMTAAEHTGIHQAIAESIVSEEVTGVVRGEIDPRALRGALYLDEHFPGWAKKMNLKTFDLASSDNCVVGQLYGDYDRVASVFHEPVEPYCLSDEIMEKAQSHGFVIEDDDEFYRDERFGGSLNKAYEHLGLSWRILIAERQS